MPDTGRRFVLRVPPDPYLPFHTNDYSLELLLVGRRVEAETPAPSASCASASSGRSPGSDGLIPA